MPVLKHEQKTREIILPDSKAKVSIFYNVSYGKMVEIRTTPADEHNSSIPAIVALINDWDLTNEKLEKLPINAENIKKLSKDDGDFLLIEISKEFSIGQKKTSELK